MSRRQTRSMKESEDASTPQEEELELTLEEELLEVGSVIDLSLTSEPQCMFIMLRTGLWVYFKPLLATTYKNSSN